MLYYLDGYNLLFYFAHSKKSLKTQRDSLIGHLHKQFEKLSLSGVLVFDGTNRNDEESGLSYKSPLTIAYASKGQSADAYIVEQIEFAANPKLITVVTDDQGLTRHARSHGAKAQSNSAFLSFLKRKSDKSKLKTKPEVTETPQNIRRLIQIFEERMETQDD